MKRPENNEWLDKVLTEAIDSKKPQTDFEQWKQQHPDAIKMLTSRASTHTASRDPLRIRNIIMKNPLTKFVAAAAIIIAVLIGIGHFGRNGSSIALADITEQFEKKMKAVKCYYSQFYNKNMKGPATFISDKKFIEYIEARAAFYGFQIGVKYGEPFYIEEELKIDPFQLL